jgi:hypothetical protein
MNIFKSKHYVNHILYLLIGKIFIYLILSSCRSRKIFTNLQNFKLFLVQNVSFKPIDLSRQVESKESFATKHFQRNAIQYI